MAKIKFTIEKDTVKLVIKSKLWGKIRTTQEATVPLAKFLEALARTTKEQVFQPGLTVDARIIATAKYRKCNVYIVEQKPGKVTIEEELDKMGKPHTRTIFVPWVYFVLKLDEDEYTDISVFVRGSRVKEITDSLYAAPFPNIGEDGSVCMPVDVYNETGNLTDPTKILDAFIRSFWASTFVHDSGAYNDARRRIRGFPQSFSEWEKMSASKEGRSRILALDWDEMDSETVQSILDHVGYDYYYDEEYDIGEAEDEDEDEPEESDEMRVIHRAFNDAEEDRNDF